MTNLNGLEWYRTSGDNWVFGPMVRGIIRDIKAEVYFDEEQLNGKHGGWVWMVRTKPDWTRGFAVSLIFAVEECEEIWLKYENF